MRTKKNIIFHGEEERTKTHKSGQKNGYCVNPPLVRIWTYKNADEKVHTFSRISKKVKKRTNRTKNGYWVNSLLDIIQ